MKFYKLENFTWILLYFFCVCFYLCQCKETVFDVTISEIRHILKTNKACIFPPVFSVSVNLQKGSSVKLNLSRNEDFHHDSPLYVFRNNRKGHVTLMKQNLEPISDVAFYQDTTNTASVAVTCLQSEDGQIYPQLTGTFVHDRKEFLLTPVVSPSIYKQSNVYKLTQINHHYHPYYHDYRTLPGFDAFTHLQNDFPYQARSNSRHRREIKIQRPYIVDVLVVVDYQIYKNWLQRARGATDEKRDEYAKRELKRYFSHFINGVDMRYRKIPNPELTFQVKLTGFIISDNQYSYPWTELRKESSAPRNLLDADIALKDFREWINDTEGIPPHDHAMLFTGHDLFTRSENQTKLLHTAGLAFIGSMCRTNGDSVSVIEDHGGFQNVATAAHELGHSLGALHDGEKNKCDSHQRYIMAASGYGPVPPEFRHNQWHFSNCSLSYFRNFTLNLARYGYTCLTETYSNAGTVERTEMPGQLYGPDDQCRLIWGQQSYLCRGAEFGNSSSMCTAMYCRDPNTVNDCVLHTAARGTSCGNKQWCIDGECIFSSKAPEKSDDCVLGDQPGIAFIGKTCSELIDETPAYCYQPKVKARCCGSCRNKYTWKLDCPYGDRSPTLCKQFSNLTTSFCDLNKDNCCETCKVEPPNSAGTFKIGLGVFLGIFCLLML